eukprot:1215530-Alexandrium_andersonii.AAC.1
MRKLAQLHSRLGHRANSVMVEILRRAGCDKNIIKAARDFECPSCKARELKTSRRAVAPYFPAGLGVSVGTD